MHFAEPAKSVFTRTIGFGGGAPGSHLSRGISALKILSLLRSWHAADPARLFIKRAAMARSAGRFRDAAALYAEALRGAPSNGGLHVQAGHMFKEARDFERAEIHYSKAAALMPDDADLALQFGHFYQTLGRLMEAHGAYSRAAELAPGWEEPHKEIARLHSAGWRTLDNGNSFSTREALAGDPNRLPLEPEVATAYGTMAPEHLPHPFSELVRRSEPSLNIVQFGAVLNTFWGMRHVARGVEAIRGFCISTEPLIEVTALVNGIPIHVGPLKGPYELEYEPDRARIHKYVFNIWYDFSLFAPGRYALELRFRDSAFAVRTLAEDFVVEPALCEADHPGSDALITLSANDVRPIEEQIAERPSAVHDAIRPPILPEINSILVMRADQLGDLVASIPAIRRLRALFPAAKLVGLMSPSNVDLARTLDIFDDTVTVDFRESMELRKRTLSWDKQVELRDRLAPYRFDVAIDLSLSAMSRALLALSGAPFLYGFKDRDWPRLSASVDDAYVDPKNRRDMTAHSTRVLAMIEQLARLSQSGAEVIRRADLTREPLRAFNIADDERYAVIHMGARIVFSRWPHYPALAERLHRETDLKIVIFSNGVDIRAGLPTDIAASDRLIILDQQLAFDEFDALLSFCSVYIGNDSGPKHLASLRGVPVVSIHSARINWSEWGQEHTGVIITRKLPCAGCSIYHDVDNCGKDFVCITAIRLDEVYTAVRRYV